MYKIVHCTSSSRVHCAHMVCAVACTAPRSRACLAHNWRRSRAQRAQVASIVPKSWAQVATSLPRPSPCQVATSLPGRDLLDDQARSRRQPHVATSLPPNQENQVVTSKGVATPIPNRPGRDLKRGRDTNGQCRSCDAKTGRPHNQVATSISGRNLKPSLARSQRPFLVATSS